MTADLSHWGWTPSLDLPLFDEGPDYERGRDAWEPGGEYESDRQEDRMIRSMAGEM